MDEQTARREIVRVGKLMYERSYVVSSDGNVSVRLDDGRVVATPTQTCKGRMTEEMLAVTDLEGRALNDRRASSELAMHLLIYREREDVRSVCHAHPPHGSAFAVAGLAIDQPILSEVILTLGCVPLAEYGTPSTDELTEAMRPLVKNHNALLMANHGAVAYGADSHPRARPRRRAEPSARIHRETDRGARARGLPGRASALPVLRLPARDAGRLSHGRARRRGQGGRERRGQNRPHPRRADRAALPGGARQPLRVRPFRRTRPLRPEEVLTCPAACLRSRR